MATRIGPRMQDAVDFVAANPGLPQMQAAKAVGPNGSHWRGCFIIYRAIDAGLIEWVRGPHGAKLLYVTGSVAS